MTLTGLDSHFRYPAFMTASRPDVLLPIPDIRFPTSSFVEVAVNSGAPSRSAFTYRVPEGMALTPGDGVLVPFGRRSLQGIVLELTDTSAVGAPREVEARLD